MSAEVYLPEVFTPQYNLPLTSTSFVGREAEVTEIAALLVDASCRLLTLVGPGGIGKTRLAIEVAQRQKDTFPNGVYFVALQPLANAEDIVSAIAGAIHFSLAGQDRGAIGFGTRGKHSLHDQLLDYLREKHLLLILDNFEHLLEGVELATKILETAPGVKILATSREALNLRQEWVRPVMGMRYPTGRDAGKSNEPLDEYSAIQLFIERAHQVRGDFSLQQERECVIRVCRMVEGMPLAIELAASWLKSLSCADIAAEIQRNADILSTTVRDIPERHRSIRAVFDSSWKMLSEEEQRVFRWLAVFRGSATREAIQAITRASLGTLSALVDKSLVKSASTGRYRIHALLRQYAGEHLEAAGETHAARTAHSVYYADFLHERETGIKDHRQITTLNEIEAEFENIRAAWKWAVQNKDADSIHNAVECLCIFLWMRDHWQYGESMMRHAQEVFAPLPGHPPDLLAARLMLRYHDHAEDPNAYLRQALEVVRAYKADAEIALGLYMLGGVTLNEGDFTETEHILKESVTYYQKVNDVFHVAEVGRYLAWLYGDMGDIEMMLRYAREALEIAREIGDKHGLSLALNQVGTAMFLDGDFEEAERYKVEAKMLAYETNYRMAVAWILTDLGGLYALSIRGDLETAKAKMMEAYALAKDINDAYTKTVSLIWFSILACIKEDYAAARRLRDEIQTAGHLKAGNTINAWGEAILAAGLGDYPAAKQKSYEILDCFADLQIDVRVLMPLPIMAVVLANEGDPTRAVELLALALTHPNSMTGWIRAWPLMTRLQETLRETLGERAYESARERGVKADLRTTVADLLSGLKKDIKLSTTETTSIPTQAQAANLALVEPLSEREMEVLQLIGEGYSNREIAETLFIGVSTVKKHITHIYGKLGADTRTRAIAQARTLHLLV